MVSFKNLRKIIEVQGNGNVIAKEVKVSSFLRLHLAVNCTIELHQSDDEKVIIETDENLQEYFSICNSGRTLYVSAEGMLRKPIYTQCGIKVYLRQLDTLYVRNEKGNVVCPDVISLSTPLTIKIQSIGNTQLAFNAPSLKILSQCEGNVELIGKSNIVEIKNQSQGNFDASGLIADSLTIRNMAQGNIDLFAEKEISIKHMGEGYVHYRGNAVLKEVKQYGAGDIRHVND